MVYCISEHLVTIICIVSLGICLLLLFLGALGIIMFLSSSPRSLVFSEESNGQRLVQDLQSPLKFNSSNNFQPLCDKYFKTADGDSDLLVVPRRAYYDNRNAWKPTKGNVVVVLVEMSDLAYDTIYACEINGYHTTAMDDLREDTLWVRSNFKGLTHSLVFVFCIFVPTEALIHGASVKLIHKRNEDNCYSRVETEFPLVVRQDYKHFEKGPNSVVVCITVFGQPPYFNEWLKYQKHLGPDLVHIATDSSFSSNATNRYPFLKEALHSGFAKMEVWRNPLGKKVFWHSQLVKYQDCMLKYLGVYQYAFMLDFDDFFNPLLPKHKDMHYYVKNFFQGRTKLTTAYVKWLNYCESPDLWHVPQNGNLTATLKDYSKTSPISSGCKAMHRIDGVLYVGIHNSFSQVKGYYSAWTDSNLAYVAHLRPRSNC